MSKHRRPRRKKPGNLSGSVSVTNVPNDFLESDEFRQVFQGEGCEPLTNELIKELASQGISSELELRGLALLGLQYNRKRNSFMMPMSLDDD